MLSLVSTWMGDRLGTLGAVGSNFSFLLFLFLYFCVCNFTDPQSHQFHQSLTWCLKATQTVPHPSLHSRVQWAIINVQKKMNFLNSFTLRMWNFVSSSWFERLRISDRKFVNHTTEMILWSMILEWWAFYKNVGLLKRLRDCWAKYSFFKKCPWDYGIFSAFAQKSCVK